MAGTPNQESCKNTSYTPGITMHLFPTEPKCRAQWIKFVQRHRVDFGETINQYASLCSAYFEPSCFENSLARSMGFKVKKVTWKQDQFRQGMPSILKGQKSSVIGENVK